MFDKYHILFIVISLILVTVTLVLVGLFLKKQEHKVIFLKCVSLATIIIHFSSIYVSFFQTGTPKVSTSMMFPILPCNVVMWFLLIIAFSKKREGVLYTMLCDFSLFCGACGGLAGIIGNDVYATTPNIFDWFVLKSLISHTILLIGVLYLLVGGFVKIRVRSAISVFVGFVFLWLDGNIIIGIYNLCGFIPPNSMYLLSPPIQNVPFINFYTMGLGLTLLAFVEGVIVEHFALTKEERWYNVFK